LVPVAFGRRGYETIEPWGTRFELREVTLAVGIDIGGTKVAAGLVDVATGDVLERAEVPTRPERGGAAVLADCARLAGELGGAELPVGIGLCELVDLDGSPSTAETVDWRGLEIGAGFEASRVVLESDVRAGALAEACFGAGRSRSPFLYVVVGTGASACLVVDGRPYRGAHGNAIVLGAPPVEQVASGSALARRAGTGRAEMVLNDPTQAHLVDEAAAELARVLAVLANALDPELIVLAGGLGRAEPFLSRVRTVSALVAYPELANLTVVPSALGGDGGIIGAALAAVEDRAR
jgi:glucokinase